MWESHNLVKTRLRSKDYILNKPKKKNSNSSPKTNFMPKKILGPTKFLVKKSLKKLGHKNNLGKNKFWKLKLGLKKC